MWALAQVCVVALLALALPRGAAFVGRRVTAAAVGTARLQARMPNAAELAELDRILSGEQEWEDPDAFDWSQVPSNKPRTPAKPKPPKQAEAQQQQQQLQQRQQPPAPPKKQPILAPNANWRNSRPGDEPQPLTALSSSSTSSSASFSAPRTRQPPSPSPSSYSYSVTTLDDQMRLDAQGQGQGQGDSDDDDLSSLFSSDEFDYDDFEAALRELETPLSTGLERGQGAKHSAPPVEPTGLQPGAVIPEQAWASLLDPAATATAAAPSQTQAKAGPGATKPKPKPQPQAQQQQQQPPAFSFARVHKSTSDLCVVFCDPRRSSEAAEFRLVLEQLGRLPLSAGSGSGSAGGGARLCVAAVCEDDQASIRRLLKKNPAFSFPVLSDPTKRFSAAAGARTPDGRLSGSALLLLDVKRAAVIKSWSAFEASMVRDLVLEAVAVHRAGAGARS